MKKLIFATILCLSITLTALAANQLIDGATTTGDGQAFPSGSKDHTMTCYFTNTSTVTGLIVRLKGSIGKSRYDSWGTHTFDATELSKKQATFHVANKGAETVMGNISSITKSGSINIGCIYMPY